MHDDDRDKVEPSDASATGGAGRSRAARLWTEWLKPVLVVIVVLCAMRSSLADWNDVPTQSMEPTILVGDRIAVNKLAYGLKVPFTTWHLLHWSAPQPGEVVVFFHPTTGERMVKRIIGVPGDHVSMISNRLYINGRPVEMTQSSLSALGVNDLTDTLPALFATEKLAAGTHALMFQPTRPARRSFAEVTVPAGQYLVMGDNRDNSADSRYFGLVPRDDILGRVFGIAFSLDHRGSYRPRWGRFFHEVD